MNTHGKCLLVIFYYSFKIVTHLGDILVQPKELLTIYQYVCLNYKYWAWCTWGEIFCGYY